MTAHHPEAKATPGPWRIERNDPKENEHPFSIVCDDGEPNCPWTICEVIELWSGTDRTKANANLISAAPDYANAAERLLDCLVETDAGIFLVRGDRNADYNAALRDLRSARAKATGAQTA